MDVAGEGVSVYAEAKGEYTKQLCQYMVPALQQYFLDLLEEAKLKEAEPRKLLLAFQALLEEIADWSALKVQRETETVVKNSRCDYLEELLTAVFIAHTKVLSAIRLTTRQKKLQITIPKLDHFLHKTLTECARLLWSNTYLFSPSAPAIERQKNLRAIESLLNDGVLQSIRGMLPVKNILREYLKDDDSDDDEEEDATAPAEPAAPPAVPASTESSRPATPPTTPVKEESSGNEAAETSSAAAATPVLIVEDTSAEKGSATPATPVFTGIDTLFNASLPVEAEEDSDSEMEEEEIKIVDAPPEPLDGFEDLEEKPAPPAAAPPKEDDTLTMDFEELE